tara:strand:- start:173 stop:1171 length:999 start_codon:yes stop_codon:yes gene_type:complete
MSENYDEIDLIEIAKTAWNSKKLIVTISFVFILMGVLSTLLSPVSYTSSTTFIPSSAEGSTTGSSLSGVASLVGISLGATMSGSEIPPAMYPQISESVEFKRLMLEEFIDEKKQIIMKNYLTDYYKIEGNSEVNNSNKSFVSKFEDDLFKIINTILTISVDKKDGFVTISSNMPKSEYAAYTTINARNILQKIIINNKIRSAKENLKFSEQQLKSKRMEFNDIQNKLGYFNDSNLNIVTSSIINERKKLEAEFEIINAVMVELSKQVEQNKIQVNKDTPVFSIVKEATMPIQKTSPKRTQMVLIFGFIGFTLSMFYVLTKKPLLKIIREITS